MSQLEEVSMGVTKEEEETSGTIDENFRAASITIVLKEVVDAIDKLFQSATMNIILEEVIGIVESYYLQWKVVLEETMRLQKR